MGKGGTFFSRGVQIFHAISEIFVPGGTFIMGVQILRDVKYFMHVIAKVTLMMFDDVPNSIIATMHFAAQ